MRRLAAAALLAVLAAGCASNRAPLSEPGRRLSHPENAPREGASRRMSGDAVPSGSGSATPGIRNPP